MASKRNILQSAILSGVDPTTGEYLSPAQRKAIFRKRNISSERVFGRPGALVKVAPSKIAPVVQPLAEPSGSLVKRINILENQVSFLTKSIEREAEIEKQTQKEFEKTIVKEDEKKARLGKEKALEKGFGKLLKPLLAPVKALGSKTKGILDTILDFFGVLFAGWLTDKGLNAIRDNILGDNEELKNIGIEVGKALAAATGVFALLNGGIFTILGIAGSITAAILTAPFKLLGKGLRSLGGGVKPPDASSVKPPAGVGGGGVTGTSFSPGQQRGAAPQGGGPQGKSTFELEQARKAQTQANMTKPEGPKGPMDRFRRFLRGNLAKFETSKKGRAIFKALNWMKTGPVGKVSGFLFNPFIKAFEWAGNLLKPKNLKAVGDKLSKFKGLGRLMGPLFALIDVGSRANMGMSPAQAIIPAIFKALLTSGAGALGAAVPIPGLNIATSIAGGFAGAWLGDQLMSGIDGMWDKSWDKTLFQGFNDAIKGIGKSDPSGIINKIFPYDGIVKPEQTSEQKILNSTQKGGMFEGYDPKDLQWNEQLGIAEVKLGAASKYTDSEGNPINRKPAAAPASASIPQITPPSSPSFVPGPAVSAQPQIIYKRVPSSAQGQGSSLKSGSATDVPSIPSSNPDNFYTLYSQMNYNVVI